MVLLRVEVKVSWMCNYTANQNCVIAELTRDVQEKVNCHYVCTLMLFLDIILQCTTLIHTELTLISSFFLLSSKLCKTTGKNCIAEYGYR